MEIEQETAIQRETLPETVCMECPLQVAMEEIARVAVQQHVLYLEGECQPRPELMGRLESWSSLHALIRSHICVTSREGRISPDALEGALDMLTPPGTDDANDLRRSALRTAIMACARATSCPLGHGADSRT